MKKSRIFLATGAFALAISAVFASKASRKFTTSLTTAAIGSTGWLVKGSTAVFTAAKGGNLLTVEFALYTTVHPTVLRNVPASNILATAGGKFIRMIP
jgi:hypothetical protein